MRVNQREKGSGKDCTEREQEQRTHASDALSQDTCHIGRGLPEPTYAMVGGSEST